MIRGDSWIVDWVDLTWESDGSPIDLTDPDVSVRGWIRSVGPDGIKVAEWANYGLDGSIPGIDPVQGQMRFYLSATATQALEPGTYSTDLEITYAEDWAPDDLVASTPAIVIKVTEDVTGDD